MNNFIPLAIPNFEGNERKYVDEAIEQGWVSTGGAYITALEKNMSEYLNVEDTCACQSGTAALHLALIELGVKPGDMVIAPTLTFIAAVNPIRYQFADPIFMDCDDSLCMDPTKLELFCKNECQIIDDKLIYKKTQQHIKALIVVHIFGNMADMESIMDISERYHLLVIEDATEALGTKYISGKYAGKYAGTIGDYGAYSFNGNKIITTGGGGAVTAKKKESVQHMRYLSTQAKDDSHYYIHNEIGYNYRMTNVQAALGVAQLEELPEYINRKNKNYDRYLDGFAGYQNAELLPFRNDIASNKWFYSLKIDMKKVNGTMKDIISLLEVNGIQTRAIWGLIHKQKPYKNSEKYLIEKAEYYSNCILNIPCSTQITKEEILITVREIKKVLNDLVQI